VVDRGGDLATARGPPGGPFFSLVGWADETNDIGFDPVVGSSGDLDVGVAVPMSENKKVCHEIKTVEGVHHGWMIWCPGCGFAHVFDGRWQFDGDREKPTFVGSMLVHRSPNWPAEHSHGRCHSFVRDGRIQFLSDCDHELAGQTVDLKPWGDE